VPVFILRHCIRNQSFPILSNSTSILLISTIFVREVYNAYFSNVFYSYIDRIDNVLQVLIRSYGDVLVCSYCCTSNQTNVIVCV
jgi:hypothetical protein